jgi:SSS family solute:Na+ symporter
MLAAMFSATMANLSANFNLKSAILSKDIYQTLFRPQAGERELLITGAIMTTLVGGITIALAAVMAARGESIFQVMMTFNTLISLSYGPPALLGLVFRRTPWWSGIATFATGLALGMIGDFVFHWTFIQQIIFVLPPSFAVFFLSMLFDRQESVGRASLFKRLNTPIDLSEISDAPDFSLPVFRFLSRAVAGIGLASLLLLIPNPPDARMTIISFSAITLAVAGSLWLIPAGVRPSRRILKEAQEKP